MNKKKERSIFSPLNISICVILLYFIWPYFMNALVNMANIHGELALYMQLIADFLLLGLIVFIYYNSIKEDFKKLKTNFKKVALKSLAIFAIGLVLYTITSIIIVTLFPNIESDNTNSLLNIFDNQPILLFISTIFYYPIIEELVFKKTFKDIINNKWAFVIITAILNASFEVLLSYNNLINIVNIIPSFILYATYSYMYYERDSIVVPIAYRMLYNLIPNIATLLSIGTILTLCH